MARIAISMAVVGAACWAGGPAPAADPPRQDAEAEARSRAALDRHLATIPGAEAGQIEAVSDVAVAATFPSRRFYAVRFRQYPVARLAPPPLRPSNIFIVSPDGRVGRPADEKALDTFFRSALAPVKNDAGARDAARAWLRLAQEFHQDGFFRFAIPEDAVTVATEEGRRIATGKAVVAAGGKGEIVATLTFDADGKLAKVESADAIKQGIRPICQATKLLDPDPIVRRMAEQDILVMGRDAEGYLNEQRARAAPELRRAIDRIWERILAEGW